MTKGNSLSEDLFQHCVILLYERNVLAKLRNENAIYSYFFKTAFSEWTHPSSKFNKEFKRLKETVFEGQEEVQEGGAAVDCFELNDKPFNKWLNEYLCSKKKDKKEEFLNELFLCYLEVRSTRKLAKLTGIHYQTVNRCINIYKKHIENEYNTNSAL